MKDDPSVINNLSTCQFPTGTLLCSGPRFCETNHLIITQLWAGRTKRNFGSASPLLFPQFNIWWSIDFKIPLSVLIIIIFSMSRPFFGDNIRWFYELNMNLKILINFQKAYGNPTARKFLITLTCIIAKIVIICLCDNYNV